MKQKQNRAVYQSYKSNGIGYLLDLLCVTRVGRKAPGLFQKRGYKMAVFSNDYIGILINQFGLYEHDELELLFSFLKPIHNILLQGNALDIGANIGNHSLYFASFFSKVYSFEPNPDTYDLLKINAKNHKNITTYNYGFGEEDGSFFLQENSTNIGGSYIVDSENKETVEIKILKLNSFINEVSDVVFIKIDVEGFEEKVFRGGMDFIKKHQPIIVFEQDEQVFGEDESPSIKLLRELGYHFYWQYKEKRIKPYILRKFINFYRIVIKKNMKIVTGPYVPKQFHSMLIAVPSRFNSALNL